MRANNNGFGTVTRRNESYILTRTMTNAAANTVRKNPLKTLLYVCGVLLCLFFKGFIAPEAVEKAYQMEQNEVNEAYFDELAMKHDSWKDMQVTYHNSKGWFFSCNEQCQIFKSAEMRLRRDYEAVKDEYDAKMRGVRAQVGVFSDHAVSKAREDFDETYNNGKAFATRQSMWDALWIAMDSRSNSDGAGSLVLRILLNYMFNFTIGLVIALFSFLWRVTSIIHAFGVSLYSFEGLIFFALAALGSAAFVLSFFVGGYAAVTAVAFTVEATAGGKLLNYRSTDGRIRDREE